ncbi:hypothetical protein JK628_05520 [Shewanella sp. KX20019]|uniref:hypothetical protein n=1 Tax=Shewanella sp. KX20019 TaxID=2803864 RepID=UPI00192554AA|nr:hypothetical protein [Shewanella sp. KX20019]QQX81326.1 hypothetical protein JK628_05520 [Shewanella sp. KX20019]
MATQVGGILALYTMFSKPQLFNNYLAISPNGWWSHKEMVGSITGLTDVDRPL